MSENIELLKRIVSNYSERHRNDEEKINWLYKERKKQTLEIFSLEKELAALREKYRWRKQSEEPAPKDELVIAIRMFPETDSYDFRQARGVWLTDDWYWRPLDLLELERIEGHPIHVN